ncbi:hypothetical protein K438DRAFT_1883876 [Mycena galopus ATCC 62051]|nr:hypothetical protein K438DRAFT_1883876 [Mycena galopus ATCC 62051]
MLGSRTRRKVGVAGGLPCLLLLAIGPIHDGTHRAALRESKASSGRHGFRGLHLACSDGRWVEWKYSCHPKGGLDRLGYKHPRKCCSEHLRKLCLAQLPSGAFFKRPNLQFPCFLHPCETDDVQALECMGTVWWISQDNDVVLLGVSEQLRGVMGTMAVKQ